MRAVGLDARGELCETLLPGVPEATRMPCPDASAPLGAIFEPTEAHWSLDIMRRASCLAALYLDYGHTVPAFGDTLQAVRAQAAEHPLTSPGEADLTMQVDFAAHIAHFLAALPEIAIDGPVTQAEFLGALGIAERASRLMAASPAHAADIELAVARLMAPVGMGTRFKALGLRTASLPPLPALPPLDISDAAP